MTDTPASYDGTLERTADGGRIRFERHLRFPVAAVWDAITNPERLADGWLPFEAVDDGCVLRLTQHVDDVSGAVEGCFVVGLQTSLARLVPVLEGSPVPWDWDAFAAARQHYAAIGLATKEER